MKLLAPCLLVLLALGTGCSPAAAPAAEAPKQEQPNDGLENLSHEELARQLLVVTGAGNLGKQVMDGMMQSFSQMPGLPPEFLERFRQNAHPDELMQLVIPVYVKHYDKPTLIAAIRFYQSQPGTKLVEGLPAVTAESMELGQIWGQQLAEKTMREMQSAQQGQ